MAARGFMLKMRPRMAGAKRSRARRHVKSDVERLERLEERLESVTSQINREVEELEGAKHYVASKKELGWIRGEISELALQDFVGAVFGAMFFAMTQEVWELALGLSPLSTFLVFLLSFSVGYLLVYLSRRRKFISRRAYHTSFLRAIEIYAMSIVASGIFVALFTLAPDAAGAAKEIIVIALPAVISAATADLLFY
ncbi:MAG: DUF2391 family protein [Candidatus Aenigmatarchaeota archaeon]